MRKEGRVRSTQASLENVEREPGSGLLSVGDAQIDGTPSVAECGNRHGIGSMEQSG